MTAVRLVSGSLDDGTRREMVYGGDVIVFRDVEPMRELCALTDGLAREKLNVDDPVHAHRDLAPSEYESRIKALREDYRKHPEARQLLLSALEAVGAGLVDTFWDWLYLRVAPPGEGGLGYHRDTWSSNVYAQTNWWTPIYPIDSERSLAFYPAYWRRPLKNTSANWDLGEVRARRRAGESVRLVPEPCEVVDASSELRLVPEPGDLLCFSGAHLHASVRNRTDVARFSIEVRTVDGRDVCSGAGAPNVDGEAPRVALGWFRGVGDGVVLREFAETGGRVE